MPNNDYTPDSYNNLQNAIAHAQNFINSNDYTPQDVTNEISRLQAAINSLANLPDTSELQALVIVADKIENDGYSKPTWKRFGTARTSAHYLLASTYYTAPQVTATTIELKTSMTELRLLPDASALQALISERGSNENANKLIRRFIPKGSDISKYSEEYITDVQNWINNYPRRILGYYTPLEGLRRDLGIVI